MSAASKLRLITKGTTMRRTNLIEDEILKTDPVSEVILTASGILLFLPLLVLLILAFSHTG
jgi:hypothetical protein